MALLIVESKLKGGGGASALEKERKEFRVDLCVHGQYNGAWATTAFFSFFFSRYGQETDDKNRHTNANMRRRTRSNKYTITINDYRTEYSIHFYVA